MKTIHFSIGHTYLSDKILEKEYLCLFLMLFWNTIAYLIMAIVPLDVFVCAEFK